MLPIRCLFCSQGNPEGSKYCNDCGAPLHVKPCRSCAAVDARAATHCYQCGEAFAPGEPVLAVKADDWFRIEADLIALLAAKPPRKAVSDELSRVLRPVARGGFAPPIAARPAARQVLPVSVPQATRLDARPGGKAASDLDEAPDRQPASGAAAVRPARRHLRVVMAVLLLSALGACAYVFYRPVARSDTSQAESAPLRASAGHASAGRAAGGTPASLPGAAPPPEEAALGRMLPAAAVDTAAEPGWTAAAATLAPTPPVTEAPVAAPPAIEAPAATTEATGAVPPASAPAGTATAASTVAGVPEAPAVAPPMPAFAPRAVSTRSGASKPASGVPIARNKAHPERPAPPRQRQPLTEIRLQPDSDDRMPAGPAASRGEPAERKASVAPAPAPAPAAPTEDGSARWTPHRYEGRGTAAPHQPAAA